MVRVSLPAGRQGCQFGLWGNGKVLNDKPLPIDLSPIRHLSLNPCLTQPKEVRDEKFGCENDGMDGIFHSGFWRFSYGKGDIKDRRHCGRCPG
jgi:hypothetical protein